MDVRVREATIEDEPDVVSFTQNTWPDREGDDYLPRVFGSWVRDDDEATRTLVAEADGRAIGVIQACLLSEWEAWVQAVRVDPDYRGRGVGRRLVEATHDWARGRGAAVSRDIVFSWNAPGLALSLSAGFEPMTEFRWAYPEPDADADPGARVGHGPDAAWAYWGSSGARESLSGLALDPDRVWALSELTRERVARAAEERWLGVVERDGVAGFALRTRTVEREGERVAEYGVSAWRDSDAARALFAAMARDAGGLDADAARVLIPATVGAASDAVAAGSGIDGETEFVLAADLTRGE